MRLALRQARLAARRQEVPVGAVVVRGGVVLAQAHNAREHRGDPCAHAEVLALRRAARKLGGWNLHGCELFVTLEPCPMCAGALINARVARVVYAAADKKAGCCGSLYQLLGGQSGFNHRPTVTGGVLAEESAALLRAFFAARR